MEFIKSAKNSKDYPQSGEPEVALAGRSNAGKSSFLNALAGRKIAHVSTTPGKTRLLNFFRVGGKYHLVDMPGYGFAARSGDEMVSWQEMVEGYLISRRQLRGLLLIMDSRRDWSAEENQLWEWLRGQGLPIAVVMTKIDKLGKNELTQRKRNMTQQLAQNQVEAPLFWVSSLKKVGISEVEEFLFQEWVKPRLKTPQ